MKRKHISITFRSLRRFGILALFMIIEFADELIGSGMDAVLPLIRDELGLTYIAIGILLSVPGVVSSLLNPIVSIWGDLGKRRLIVLAGGIVFVGALLLRGTSFNFVMLLISMILFYPASGSFVSLTEASLMDIEPKKKEINMSRWTFAGSLGMVLGPFAVAGMMLANISWRWFFIGMACLAAVLVIFRSMSASFVPQKKSTLKEIWQDVKKAVKSHGILKWLVIIQFGDLMVDVFMGFLALYMVDVGGATPAQAALAVGVWTIVGLAGDFLLIPLLSRVKGLVYLRMSAIGVALLFPSFLLVPWLWVKFVLLGLLGFLNSGWYSILMAQIYESVPGKSGTALALFNISCVVGTVIPFLIGTAAHFAGLEYAIWLLLLGPIALVLGIRKKDITAE